MDSQFKENLIYFFEINQFVIKIIWNNINNKPYIIRINLFLKENNLPKIFNSHEKLSKCNLIDILIEKFNEYFSGKNIYFPFEYLYFENFNNSEIKVFQELIKINFGNIITYKQLADRVGFIKKYRLTGKILSKNSFPIIIPCHRVIKSNNEIGGYSEGIEIKKLLLENERIIIK